VNAASTFVALLRGINVGGRNTIPMVGLKASFAALGLDDVLTYVQSGNVVFRSPLGDGSELAGRIERRIAEDFALRVTVVLRTPPELSQVAVSNPFLGDETDLAKLHVVFLDRKPQASAVARLDPERSTPDRFSPRGREIYLHLPNDAARSKLTLDYFERRLGVRATARNWKTVLKLLELTQA